MQKQSNSQILIEAHHDFSRGLSKYAHLKISDSALSEDLVQATFMKTWVYLQKTGKIELMRAFLYHVLNRLIIDEYRKHKAISLDLLSDGGFELATIKSENLFNIIDGKTLVALIVKLPEKYRNVINMRFISELSLKEMSFITAESQNAMSVQVHRGLAKLKVLYAGSLV